MIFAAIEIAIYAASLTGALAAIPFCFWLIGLSEPTALAAALTAAPFLMWACGIAHWRTYERARPFINSAIYRVASMVWHTTRQSKQVLSDLAHVSQLPRPQLHSTH